MEGATDFIPKDRKKEEKKGLRSWTVNHQRSHVALVLTNLVETGDGLRERQSLQQRAAANAAAEAAICTGQSTA